MTRVNLLAQYRVDGGAGFWRHFDVNNQTQTRDVVYLVESVFHEMMLQVLQPDAQSPSRWPTETRRPGVASTPAVLQAGRYLCTCRMAAEHDRSLHPKHNLPRHALQFSIDTATEQNSIALPAARSQPCFFSRRASTGR